MDFFLIYGKGVLKYFFLYYAMVMLWKLFFIVFLYFL